LNGPLSLGDSHKAIANFVQANLTLANQVEMFWRVEASELLSKNDLSMSVDDRQAISIWEQGICKNGGHYELSIPFKSKRPNLSNNKIVAVRRLQLLGKRLSRDTNLYHKYCAGIQDLLTKGYSEEVPVQDISRDDGAVWYLPHHPVFHPIKDKLRIVFDCAAKYTGSSLNDHVLKGPDLMNILPLWPTLKQCSTKSVYVQMNVMC
jgi:hypothetical protein